MTKPSYCIGDRRFLLGYEVTYMVKLYHPWYILLAPWIYIFTLLFLKYALWVRCIDVYLKFTSNKCCWQVSLLTYLCCFVFFKPLFSPSPYMNLVCPKLSASSKNSKLSMCFSFLMLVCFIFVVLKFTSFSMHCFYCNNCIHSVFIWSCKREVLIQCCCHPYFFLRSCFCLFYTISVKIYSKGQNIRSIE